MKKLHPLPSKQTAQHAFISNDCPFSSAVPLGNHSRSSEYGYVVARLNSHGYIDVLQCSSFEVNSLGRSLVHCASKLQLSVWFHLHFCGRLSVGPVFAGRLRLRLFCLPTQQQQQQHQHNSLAPWGSLCSFCVFMAVVLKTLLWTVTFRRGLWRLYNQPRKLYLCKRDLGAIVVSSTFRRLFFSFCNNSWKAEKQVCSDDLRPRDTQREAEKKGRERDTEREREKKKRKNTLKVCERRWAVDINVFAFLLSSWEGI